MTTTYEYDGMSRLKRLKDAGPGGVLFDRQYSYNAANQISQIAELTGTKVFGYDNIDRLTSVADAVNGNESYAFDGVGNRTASHLSNTYTHQPFNRLTATETGSYAHDANGNTVSKVEGSKRWTYTWDYENRLTQAWDRKTRVRYSYDALGRRVERNLGFGRERTKFTYDGEDVLLDDANGTQTKYLNGLGIDDKLGSKTGGTANYFLADHLGSTNALTDSNGAITSQASYDGFGNQTGSLTTRYGFTGRERDDFTGLMHYRARHYDPKLGRFISEDPIGFDGGDINLYLYTANNPVNFVDPLGLFQEGPRNYLRDPFDSQRWILNGLSNTVSDLLSLDSIAEWSWTIGDHCRTTNERVSAGLQLGATTFANALGGAVVGRYLGKATNWVRFRQELTVGKNLRIAPFGNRGGHHYGRFPHYHRRGPQTGPNQSASGQGIGRHRPFEGSRHDRRFRDRF